ncbi:hypothetical protein [Streptomyces sp. NPDC004284]|uniref:hypothetical protein n=1 Tax=Streptomyces sp. NPDC004284 TaxID=3364695 RepID=UPI00367B4538
MPKRTWIVAAGAAALALGLSGTAYYLHTADTGLITSSVCVPPTSKPEYVAAFASTVVIGTVTSPARYVPDTEDPGTGVAISTVSVERILKGTAPATLTVAQSVTRTSAGTYATREQLYQPLTEGGRFAIAVTDSTDQGGRWVWGAEGASAPADDDRWATAVVNAYLPDTACDDTIDTAAP